MVMKQLKQVSKDAEETFLNEVNCYFLLIFFNFLLIFFNFLLIFFNFLLIFFNFLLIFFNFLLVFFNFLLVFLLTSLNINLYLLW